VGKTLKKAKTSEIFWVKKESGILIQTGLKRGISHVATPDEEKRKLDSQDGENLGAVQVHT